MDMDFRVQVWQRVWKMAFFGLNWIGSGFENRAAHPHQEFPGVSPRESKYMFDVLLLKSKRPTRIVF